MDLAQLLADPPLLHAQRDGTLTSWRVSTALMSALDGLISEGSRTLETGAGLSTLLFALRGCHHTCVVPDPEQVERIKAWCDENGVAKERLEFVLEPSEVALPKLAPDPLDLVLIDGAHGFPAPFIDWQYAARRLSVGGTVVIDDTQIWTGKILRDFLDAEADWEITGGEPLEFATARRLREGPVGEWSDQPFVFRRSFMPHSPSTLHKTVGAAAVGYRNVRAAGQLLREREFAQLRRKMRQR